MAFYNVKNLFLCSIMWNNPCNTNEKKANTIIEDIKNCNSFSDDQLKLIRAKITKTFLPQYNRMWLKSSRRKERFINIFKSFVDSDFSVSFNDERDNNSINGSVVTQSNSTTKVVGRPRVSYSEGSPSTKRRRSQQLASNYSEEELLEALKAKQRLSGASLESLNTEVISVAANYTVEKLLAMYLDLRLSKGKYNKFKQHIASIVPDTDIASYEKLVQAKEMCYPDHIQVSEMGAKIQFISLLSHTVQRILQSLPDGELKELQSKKLILFGKWGMDGASGQQTTRQKWHTSFHLSSDTNAECSIELNMDNDTCDNDIFVSEECRSITTTAKTIAFSDASAFFISFVPLQLKAHDCVLWTNETPNSVFFCRPVKFVFAKETTDLIQKEYNYYTELLRKVQTYILNIEDMSFKIQFDLQCTMIDGKVCNAITGEKASCRCNICGVGPKYINDLNYVQNLPCKTNYYKLGLSTLHAWIRSLEYLLHISYNLDFCKGSARTSEQKTLKKERKKIVQESLRRISITVDIVIQGKGTSNTGNVARSFFAQANEVSAATGINENLIKRFHIILQVLACGSVINSQAFEKYAFETAKICVELYPWYNLPPSIHKLLIHGSKIIEEFVLPIGWYSEEPQECNNKIFRKARAENSRMCNRKMANTDTIHHLLIASDPLISQLRIKEKRKTKELSMEAKNLLS